MTQNVQSSPLLMWSVYSTIFTLSKHKIVWWLSARLQYHQCILHFDIVTFIFVMTVLCTILCFLGPCSFEAWLYQTGVIDINILVSCATLQSTRLHIDITSQCNAVCSAHGLWNQLCFASFSSVLANWICCISWHLNSLSPGNLNEILDM